MRARNAEIRLAQEVDKVIPFTGTNKGDKSSWGFLNSALSVPAPGTLREGDSSGSHPGSSPVPSPYSMAT